MNALAVLATLALLLLLPLAVSAVRQRSSATMAVRNIGRRRAEAALVVCGALLGTAVITSSLVVGDVIEGSFADRARTQYGPIDIVVTPAAGADPQRVEAAVDAAGLEGVDGLLPVTTSTATIEAPRRDAAVPQVRLVELDLDAARAFGSDPRITGLVDTGALGPGEILVNERTARRLGARPGDELRLHAYGSSTELTLTEVVAEVGLAGYGGAVVPPGTIARLAGGATGGAAPPRDRLLVSLDGGVFDTRARSAAAAASLRAAVAGLPGVEVAAEKAAVLADAERDSAGFAELFGTIGAFSVLAGILLLINLFVMLAEERKSELGMLRAVGFTRGRLTRAFAIEGAIYALVAAALGAVSGLGVGWLVAVLAGGIYGIAEEGGSYPLMIEPLSLALGASVGLVISLVTIWATSLRIARLNIIRAIRDLPEPRAGRARGPMLALAGVGVVLGAAVGLGGYVGENAIALLLGLPLAAFSAAPLLRRFLAERPARLLVAGSVLAWGLSVQALFPGIMGAAGPIVFVLLGVVLTAGAVSLASGLDRFWALAIERLGRGGRGLSARLGIAYPLARRFRTSMLLGMFSLVIFTVTIMASVSVSFDRNTGALVEQISAGYDLVLDANPTSPIGAEALLARDDVVAVAGLTRGRAEFEAAHLDGTRAAAISGFDSGLLARGAPILTARDEAYASDAAVYRAVLEDTSLAIVPDEFLVGSADVAALRVGDSFSVIDPGTGEPRALTVAAVGELDHVGNGALVGRDLTAALFGAEDVVSRSYVALADGADPEAAAAALNAAFLREGADAETFAALGSEGMRQLKGLLALLQGFLGLGLLIGIAGLGVVMVRAVRERRQEIGMLRAMGFRTGLVRSAFLFEAGLIAAQGTLIGAALGLLTTRQLLSSDAFGDVPLPFVVPWAGLALIVALPLAAALAATAWPASRAAAIPPAVALRTAE